MFNNHLCALVQQKTHNYYTTHTLVTLTKKETKKAELHHPFSLKSLWSIHPMSWATTNRTRQQQLSQLYLEFFWPHSSHTVYGSAASSPVCSGRWASDAHGHSPSALWRYGWGIRCQSRRVWWQLAARHLGWISCHPIVWHVLPADCWPTWNTNTHTKILRQQSSLWSLHSSLLLSCSWYHCLHGWTSAEQSCAGSSSVPA